MLQDKDKKPEPNKPDPELIKSIQAEKDKAIATNQTIKK